MQLIHLWEICDAQITSATIQAGSISNQSTNQSGSSSLEMITDKTTIDRNNPNDFATVSTTFNNLSGSSIDWNINTPDGREWRDDSMTWSQASNPIIKQFYLSPTVGVQNDSFTLTATDGVVTSNEIQFQVLPFNNATSSPMYASSIPLPNPSVTASVYANASSPTGRTLGIVTSGLENYLTTNFEEERKYLTKEGYWKEQAQIPITVTVSKNNQNVYDFYFSESIRISGTWLV